jgi:aspartyl protease family protein
MLSPGSRQAVSLAGGWVVSGAGSQGHYFATLDINGRPVDVMVDTGATMVALTHEDARKAGLHLRPSDFTQTVQTANGEARFAPVVLDRVSIGNITVRDVSAAVAEPGRLKVTLLGMSFLGRLQRVDMRPGMMTLSD